MNIADTMQRAYRLAIVIMVSLILAAPFQVYNKVEASDFTNRSLHLSDSKPGVNTTHQANMDFITATSVGSISIEYCSNSPLFIVACIAPVGMDLTTAVLSSETGETGFSTHANTNANRIVLTRVPAMVTPQQASYLFSNVDNPTSAGSYYARFGSYASVDGTGSRIDEGGLAISINNPVNVGAYVPPILLFCVGVTIPTNSCASANGNNIDFGDFLDSTTSYGTLQMLAATNGFGGYTIAVTGTTMTSGNDVIPNLTTPTASTPGVSQFGMNLVDNSSPNVGINTTGFGSGSPTADYNIANRFKYLNGDTVASSSLSSDINRFTTSFVVNVADNQKAGVYATTLTYIAFASF